MEKIKKIAIWLGIIIMLVVFLEGCEAARISINEIVSKTPWYILIPVLVVVIYTAWTIFIAFLNRNQ